MTRVHVAEGVERLIVHTPEHARELIPAGMVAKQAVHFLRFFFVGSGGALPHSCPDRAVNHTHQERGWNPLAGNISHDHSGSGCLV